VGKTVYGREKEKEKKLGKTLLLLFSIIRPAA
jgi:hypothetical protein